MPAFPALLDACVLVPVNLTDLLLRLAEADTYRPLWSAGVLAEVRRNMLKFDDVTEAKADRRIGFMRAAFPDAEVTGYEDLIDSMTNHPKDRHVLAAAVRADAAVIVTANLKDFPRSALDPYDLDAMGPDDFLLNQLDLYPQQTVQCLRDLVADKRNPPVTVEAFLAGFVRTVPRFVAAVRPRIPPAIT
ncbi:PIN domain-containing protein [Kutzneria buriramensis]|uniref:PIN domain-containing protein n=1 Tax=Kutzneria buriramensis TaxID=1045776 RepID=A0A3E0H155_9PSEU|nr:PIN domain-containing protein [Kutzneria buriramensis]REH35779.1 PIN domain-containing protein [Kutzneria buriramensis]